MMCHYKIKLLVGVCCVAGSVCVVYIELPTRIKEDREKIKNKQQEQTAAWSSTNLLKDEILSLLGKRKLKLYKQIPCLMRYPIKSCGLK
jgi:L-lactate utilization protein LutB